MIESAQGPRVRMDGREVILLCSNDYLGLAGDPALRGAAADAAYKWGSGAGASRLVSGNMSDLEYATIANALGVSPGTVAATLNAAHAALRAQLEGKR